MNEKFIKIANRFLNEASPDSTTDTPEGTDIKETPINIEIFYADLNDEKKELIMKGILKSLNAKEDDEVVRQKVIEQLADKKLFMTTGEDLKKQLDIKA